MVPRSRYVAARIAALAVPAALAFGVPSVAISAVSETGALYVTTLPDGAEIYVDGTFVGRSPVLVDALGAGRHGVTMTKAGWVLRETSVVVPAGSVTFESERLGAAEMKGDGGTIVVRGVAADARLSLDGVRIASIGEIAASAGRHRLTIASGNVRTTREVTVFPDTTTDVLARDAAPVAASHPAAPVVASVEEWLPDAAVAMSGKSIVLRYQGHALEGRLGSESMRVDGEAVSYEGPPEMIGGKLYLPLGVLERLSGNVVRNEPKK